MPELIAAFRLRYPEFALLDDSVLTLYIGDAVSETDADFFGAFYERALSALAAHNLALAYAGTLPGVSSGGFVVSRSVGDVSVEFANPGVKTQDETGFFSTRYGQQYLNLVRRIGPQIVATSWA